MGWRRFFSFFLLASAASLSFAAQWPLAPQQLAANFGTFAKGRVSLAVVLAGDSNPVVAAEDGEISFSASEGVMPSGLPSTLGSFMVVEHRGGMAAVYAHLATGTMKTRAVKVREGDQLASPGRSGWAEGQGLSYQVFDRKADGWVNPFLVLPPLPSAGTPLIRSLSLVRDDKSISMAPSLTIPQGTYGLAVDVACPAEASWSAGPLAPYSIRLSIDGVEVAKEVFDLAKARQGSLLFFSQNSLDARTLRSPDGRYVLGQRLFTRGKSTLEVIVENAMGSSKSATWTLMVE